MSLIALGLPCILFLIGGVITLVIILLRRREIHSNQVQAPPYPEPIIGPTYPPAAARPHPFTAARRPPLYESPPGSIPTTELSPQQIGRYVILEQLGAGGMGTVYKARDPELDRVVALKIPRFDGAPAERALRMQRFQREARAAAQIWHPNVCPIYDVGEHLGQPFVVIAYLEGQSLAEVLSRHGRFEDVAQAVSITCQVLDALEAVHARGIIHRDLKPANIIIDPAGRAVLTDFGLARPDSDAEHLTSEGIVVGTPAYMAPEQAAGQSAQIGPWTDIYCLGVVLYQMLTGRLPFTGPALTVLAKIIHETPPAPATLRLDLDPTLERSLQKALAKEGNARYQTAREWAVILQDWLSKNASNATSIPVPFRPHPLPSPIAHVPVADDTPVLATAVANLPAKKKSLAGDWIMVLALVLVAFICLGWLFAIVPFSPVVALALVLVSSICLAKLFGFVLHFPIRWIILLTCTLFAFIYVMLFYFGGRLPTGRQARFNADLLLAAEKGQKVKLADLIREGADINARNSQGASTLMIAASKGYADVVSTFMLRCGEKGGVFENENLDVNAKDNQGETALMKAAENGHLNVIKLLLGPRSAFLNGRAIPAEVELNEEDAKGETALMKAKAKGHKEIVQLLKSKGARE